MGEGGCPMYNTQGSPSSPKVSLGGTSTESVEFDTESKTATVYLSAGESLTISGIPEGVTYTVTETAATGYTTTATVSSSDVDATTGMDSDGNVYASGTFTGHLTDTVIFNNDRGAGNLKIEKTVSGSNTSSTQEFTFAVTLSEDITKVLTVATYGSEDDSEVQDTSNSTSVELENSNTFTVYLKGGQYVTIEGLPEGVGYTVTETDADDYTTTVTDASGTTNEDTKEATGTITKDSTDYITFNNYKTASADTGADGEGGTTVSGSTGNGSASSSGSGEGSTGGTGSDATVASTSGILPKTGDTIGALLPILAAVALGACAVAALAAFALRKRRIH